MPVNISDQLQTAYALHSGGDLFGAIKACRLILLEDPANFDALSLCGRTEAQLGHNAEALTWLERALAVRPKNADILSAYGHTLMSTGRIDDAIRVFREAAAAVLVNNEECINLGNALSKAGRHEEALAQFDAALKTKPDLWIGHYNRGVALNALGHQEQAILAFRRALTLKPDLAEAANNTGRALEALGRDAQAIDAFRQAVKARPEYSPGWVNLGRLLVQSGELEEGVKCLSRAVGLDPDGAYGHLELGLAQIQAGRPREAVEHFRTAYTLDPNDNNAGFNLSLALLLLGEFGAGWPLYELRLSTLQQLGGSARVKANPQAARLAQKSDLAGDSLLLLGEQGLGDEIMFSSIVPDILKIVPQTTLTADARLVGLFKRSFPGLSVCTHPPKDGGRIARIPVERRFFIGSLMKLFRTRLGDFPGTPYLVADEARRSIMRARLDGLGVGPKIGVMWRGGIGSQSEHLRSMSLDDFTPLLKGEAVHWISLNHLAAAEGEVAAFSERTGIIVQHWADVLCSDDYDDTAALLAELDAVVSVRGTVAHCAAALGVPTHAFVNRTPDWRYGNEETSMPWYKAMNLYRQTDRWPVAAVGRQLGILHG